jgi:hypothetical protein
MGELRMETDSLDGDLDEDLDVPSTAPEVVEITDALVVRENGEGDDLDRVSLNLSWLGIARIENLSRYRNIQTLYLQNNQITVIEGLSELCHLYFLALQDNAITKVQNLDVLPLEFLDLSDNEIGEVDFAELPRSLVVLKLKGNPILAPYRDVALALLPALAKIDDEEPTAALGAEERADMLDWARRRGDAGLASKPMAISTQLSAQLAASTPEADAEAFVQSCLAKAKRSEELACEITKQIDTFAATSASLLGEEGQTIAQRSAERRAADKVDAAQE